MSNWSGWPGWRGYHVWHKHLISHMGMRDVPAVTESGGHSSTSGSLDGMGSARPLLVAVGGAWPP